LSFSPVDLVSARPWRRAIFPTYSPPGMAGIPTITGKENAWIFFENLRAGKYIGSLELSSGVI
jgi:hypothetical protein